MSVLSDIRQASLWITPGGTIGTPSNHAAPRSVASPLHRVASCNGDIPSDSTANHKNAVLYRFPSSADCSYPYNVTLWITLWITQGGDRDFDRSGRCPPAEPLHKTPPCNGDLRCIMQRRATVGSADADLDDVPRRCIMQRSCNAGRVACAPPYKGGTAMARCNAPVQREGEHATNGLTPPHACHHSPAQRPVNGLGWVSGSCVPVGHTEATTRPLRGRLWGNTLLGRIAPRRCRAFHPRDSSVRRFTVIAARLLARGIGSRGSTPRRSATQGESRTAGTSRRTGGDCSSLPKSDPRPLLPATAEARVKVRAKLQ